MAEELASLGNNFSLLFKAINPVFFIHSPKKINILLYFIIE